MVQQPNIILILTDQHRLSAVGCYGETQCRTPHIDRLAKEGVLFENAYTTCPVCSPARGTIMTGLYPHSHGITTNIHEVGCSVHELEDRESLLTRRLESLGYSLGYSGKWHLGTDIKKSVFGTSNFPSLPKDVGFEGQNFPGHGEGGFCFPEYKSYLKEHGFKHRVKKWSEPTELIWPAGELEGPVESTVPYFLAENSISLMESFRKRGKPFFLWHNFWGPHGPFYVPKEFIDIYRDAEIPPWPNYSWPSLDITGPHQAKIHPRHGRLSWQDWAVMIKYYYAFTTLIDSQIGRMIEYLEKSGLASNTVIVFAGDHGQTLGSHGGLTDKGWHHFEETHHIPFIMKFPERKSRQVKEFISLADFYPTVLDLAGGEAQKNSIHGMSLIPLLEGKKKNWRQDIVTEFHGLGNASFSQRTIRWGNLKYGFNCWGQDELYDLSMDPYETANMISHPSYRQAGRDLRHRLLKWMEETDDRIQRRFSLLLHRYEELDVPPIA
jgi:arylsulfatase A-like enzyme